MRGRTTSAAFSVCLGAGLDGRGQWGDGGVDWSAFGFVYDPTPDGHGGLFAAARARGSDGLGGAWRLRFDASGRAAAARDRDAVGLPRSDLSLGIEHQGGVTLGARVGDRRRSVREETLGFDRQSLLVSATWGASGGHRFRVEAGPQRAPRRRPRWARASRAPSSGRRGSALDGGGARQLARAVRRAPRDGAGGTFQALLAAVPGAPLRARRLRLVEPPVAGPQRSARRRPWTGLLGPSLIVDPLEDDENDWDIGLRKQQMVAVAARAFGRTTSASSCAPTSSAGRTSCRRYALTWAREAGGTAPSPPEPSARSGRSWPREAGSSSTTTVRAGAIPTASSRSASSCGPDAAAKFFAVPRDSFAVEGRL